MYNTSLGNQSYLLPGRITSSKIKISPSDQVKSSQLPIKAGIICPILPQF